MVNPVRNLTCQITGTNNNLLTATWDPPTAGTVGIVKYRVHLYLDGHVIDTHYNEESPNPSVVYMYNISQSGTYEVHVRAYDRLGNQSASVTKSCGTNTANDYGCVNQVCTKGAGSLPAGCNDSCSVTPPSPPPPDGCTGRPNPVTNLSCSRDGNTLSVSWTNPASGTWDRIRIHYYAGTVMEHENFVTGNSDSHGSSTVDSVHVRAFCGTYQSSSVTASCGSIPPPPVDDYGCVNSVCTQGAGTLPPGCNNTCEIPPPPQKHKECQNGYCVEVDGAGDDLCSKHADCSIPTGDSTGIMIIILVLVVIVGVVYYYYYM